MDESPAPAAVPESQSSDPARMERLMMQLRLIFALRYAQTDGRPIKLLDCLYIGSVGAAMNKAVLKEEGITHVLTVADKLSPMFPTEFTYLSIPLLDSAEANLLEILPRALEFIETAREAGGKTLVHCFAGKSRSSSVCIAYLMQRERLNLLEALRFVRTRREVVMPNTGFLTQLKQWEASLGIPPAVLAP